MASSEGRADSAMQCSICGDAEWLACAPGSEAEARVQGNVCLLDPAPEVPLRAWCLACLFAKRPHALESARQP